MNKKYIIKMITTSLMAILGVSFGLTFPMKKSDLPSKEAKAVVVNIAQSLGATGSTCLRTFFQMQTSFDIGDEKKQKAILLYLQDTDKCKDLTAWYRVALEKAKKDNADDVALLSVNEWPEKSKRTKEIIEEVECFKKSKNMSFLQDVVVYILLSNVFWRNDVKKWYADRYKTNGIGLDKKDPISVMLGRFLNLKIDNKFVLSDKAITLTCDSFNKAFQEGLKNPGLITKEKILKKVAVKRNFSVGSKLFKIVLYLGSALLSKMAYQKACYDGTTDHCLRAIAHNDDIECVYQAGVLVMICVVIPVITQLMSKRVVK